MAFCVEMLHELDGSPVLARETFVSYRTAFWHGARLVCEALRADLRLLHTIAPGKDAVRTRGQSLGFDALNDGLHRPSMLRYMKKSFIEDRPATATSV